MGKESKKIKVKVFLGGLTFFIDEWNRQWNNGDSNDPYPYGYHWAESESLQVEYIRSKYFKNKWIRTICSYLTLPIKLRNCDVVWTHYDKDALVIAALKKIPLLRRFIPKQISCFIWLIDTSRDYTPLKIKTMRWLLKSIDRIIYHSPTEEKYFTQVYQIPKNKQTFVPFGINFNSYSHGPQEQIPIIDRPFVLSVGTDRHRDIQMLINISEQLKNKIPIVLATKNPLYKNAIQGHNNIIVIEANLRQMRWLYQHSLFVIIPLLYNEHVSGCTTVLEAAAARKAVIVTNTPGMDIYVKNNETGYLVEQNDLKGFIEMINILLNDKEKRIMLGENAYRYASSKFTTQKWAAEHANITFELYKDTSN